MIAQILPWPRPPLRCRTRTDLMCISSPLRERHIQRSNERTNDVVVTVETALTVRWSFILDAHRRGSQELNSNICPLNPPGREEKRREESGGPHFPPKIKRHPRSLGETGVFVFLLRVLNHFSERDPSFPAIERGVRRGGGGGGGGEPFHVRRIRRRRLMMGRTSPYSASSRADSRVSRSVGRPRGGGPRRPAGRGQRGRQASHPTHTRIVHSQREFLRRSRRCFILSLEEPHDAFYSINEFCRHSRVGPASRGGKNHGHKSSSPSPSSPTDRQPRRTSTTLFQPMLFITRQEIN